MASIIIKMIQRRIRLVMLSQLIMKLRNSNSNLNSPSMRAPKYMKMSSKNVLMKASSIMSLSQLLMIKMKMSWKRVPKYMRSINRHLILKYAPWLILRTFIKS